MQNRELAFSTFLKLLELPEAQKAATLRGFLRGGGFNYWRPLQALAAEVADGSLDAGSIADKVGLMSSGHQRKYNQKALTSLLVWFSRRRVTLRRKPEKVVKKFSNSGLMVRIEPEIAFSMGGNEYLMHVWATNNPSLSEETLSMGLFYFRHHLQEEGYRNYQFLIFDTVKDRIFAEFNIIDKSQEYLTAQRDLLGSLWSEITEEREGEKPRRDDRFEDRPSERPSSTH